MSTWDLYADLSAEQIRNLDRFVEGEGPIKARFRGALMDLCELTVRYHKRATVFVRSLHLLQGDYAAQATASRREYQSRLAK